MRFLTRQPGTMAATRRCVLVAALAALAVTSAQGEVYEDPTYPGPKTTIRYALWGGAGEVDSAGDDCRAFVQAHPDIRVDVAVYPFGQYWAKLQTQAASGLAPDVITLWENNLGVWIERGALYELDDFIAADRLDLGQFYDAAVNLCTWDDHVYALPMGVATRTLIYSIDHLEQSGIPRDQWPRPDAALTWDQFKTLARRLTLRRPDGSFAQYGMAAGHDWQWALFRMYGGEVLDRMVNPTRPTIAGDDALRRAVIEVMQQQYGDRNTLPMIALAAGGFPNLDTVLAASDKFAMALAGPWVLPDLQRAHVRFGLSPLPRGPHPSQLISLNALGIFSGSRSPEAAWRFLRFKAASEAQARFGRQLKGVPALRSAAGAFVNNAFGIDDCEAYLYDLDIAVSRPAASNTFVAAAFIKWYDMLEQALFSEYERRRNDLPRGADNRVAPQDDAQFVAGMDRFIEATVDRLLPEFDEMLAAGFARARPRAPDRFTRIWAPLLAVAAFLAAAAGYLRWVRRHQGQLGPRAGRPAPVAGYVFLAPWLIGVLVFVAGPILISLFLSFTDWNMIKPPRWVGLLNYLQLPRDQNFLLGLRRTLAYAGLAIPISLVGGLFTAGLLTCNIRGTDAFKAIFYFPSLFTGAAAAVLWVNMFNREYGVVNYALALLHLPPVNWLDADHAFYTVILMNVFWVGGAMIIYYAGMKQIPRSLYEAADIDGAGPVRQFVSITVPMLSPVILFMTIMTTIGAFQVFTPALFFAEDSTQIGRPGDALRFYSVNIYDEAFNNLRMGHACAYAFVLFLIIFLVTMLQLRLSRRFVHSEQGS